MAHIPSLLISVSIVLVMHCLLQVLVGGRTVDTPARDNGLEYNDEIRMYAFASEDGSIGDGEEGKKLDEDKLDKAQTAKKSVIFLIWRSSSGMV